MEALKLFALFFISTIPGDGLANQLLQLPGGGKQSWGYVEVRPGAQMFWWLYYTTGSSDFTQRPLVLWLQGGPGASSTGFGNFEEIGPQDHNLKNRSHNWVNEVNVLFVDNPVGCGFSYVNDSSLLVTNNTQIAGDLLELMRKFLDKVPDFQTIPLYIFSESYGGKMAAGLALKLWKEIEKGKIKCNLKGLNLGDSWISPIDSVLTWAPYLFSTSLVDTTGFLAVNGSAYATKDALDKGKFKTATKLWEETEGLIAKYTNGVNVYNILEMDGEGESLESRDRADHKTEEKQTTVDKILTFFLHKGEERRNGVKEEQDAQGSNGLLGSRFLRRFHSDPLSDLMNGAIKDMLRIIPKNVVWGGQSQLVFKALAEDFMKPVVHVVENLLNNTPIVVNVYSGQLDLIVDTMGTMRWVEEMNWAGVPGWKKSARKPVLVNNSTEMFVKTFGNFGFYWILKAGHMVPMDAPETAIKMLQLITNTR